MKLKSGQPKFCEICGAENAMKGSGRFDPNSGEELANAVCPRDPKHTCQSGLFGNHDWRPVGGWKAILLGMDVRCSRCGCHASTEPVL